MSSALRHRVGKITENRMKSICGLITLYVTLISTQDATYARLSLCTSSAERKEGTGKNRTGRIDYDRKRKDGLG